MFFDQCNVCQEEQEELIKVSNGTCGQIICQHEIFNTVEENKEEEEEVVVQVPTKKRKHKSEKKDEEDTELFPSTSEMQKSVATSFSSLPIDVVYQITNAKKKTDEFNGEECADLTLRGKGDYCTQIVQTTKAIYNKLYEEEKYEEDCTKNNFYIMSKGVVLTSKKFKYFDFIILKKKKL